MNSFNLSPVFIRNCLSWDTSLPRDIFMFNIREILYLPRTPLMVINVRSRDLLSIGHIRFLLIFAERSGVAFLANGPVIRAPPSLLEGLDSRRVLSVD